MNIVDQYPAWAPSDSEVAFHRGIASSYGPAGVYLLRVHADGSAEPPTLLYADNVYALGELRFSPDGRQLAGTSAGQLMVLDIAAHTVTRPLYTERHASCPSWAPDGKRL